MQEILSVDLMRRSDRATISGGTSGKELMFRAATAIYKAVENIHGWVSPVAIVCGSGNNAGDGYALAPILKEAGIESHIFLTEERFSEDGKYYFDKCKGIAVFEKGFEPGKLNDYPIIVDCIYGTGFHGKVKEPVLSVIKAINSAGEGKSFVVSVDINSGMNGDSGMGYDDGYVKSDLTVSIGSFKPGHFLNMAKDTMKTTVNCPIGINPLDTPWELWEKEDVSKCFPERKNMSNKGTYGYTALIGGSDKYTGAIRLSAMAEASMRSGTGVCTVGVIQSLKDKVGDKVLESTVYPLSENEGNLIFEEKEFTDLVSRRKAVAFGMGIGTTKEVEKALRFLIGNYSGILIVDADGLNCLSKIEEEVILKKAGVLVVTPHIKEFSRLSGKEISEILEKPVDIAMEYAKKKKCILLLKGPTTIVTDGKRVIFVNRGCPGMATAGSGDVLSGIVCSVCGANGENALEAVASAAWINGRAGELAQRAYGDVSMISSDTVKFIVDAIKEVRTKND